MSLVPSDSVSRQGESNSGVERPEFSLSSPVYPSTDIISVVGPARYAEFVDAYNAQMRAYYAAYQSYCRLYGLSVVEQPGGRGCGSVVSAGAASSSDVTPSSSVCSSGSRPLSDSSAHVGKSAMRRFCRKMKAKGVAAAMPGGFCYTRAMRSEARESAAVALGSYPALGDLLSRPREEFLPATAVGSLAISLSCKGVAHVSYSRQPGLSSYHTVLSAFAARHEFDYGTYGHSLRVSASQVPVAAVADQLTLDTPVGGVQPESGFFGESTVYPLFADFPQGCLFLAGNSEKDASRGWRHELVASPVFRRCKFTSPRPVSQLSEPWVDTLATQDSFARYDWEFRAMDNASAVFFKFLPGTNSAASLAELASRPLGSLVYVECPVRHPRRSYVEYLCRRGSFEMFDSFNQELESKLVAAASRCSGSVQCVTGAAAGHKSRRVGEDFEMPNGSSLAYVFTSRGSPTVYDAFRTMVLDGCKDVAVKSVDGVDCLVLSVTTGSNSSRVKGAISKLVSDARVFLRVCSAEDFSSITYPEAR